MKVADFLERNELSGKALATQLGYVGAESVNARRRNDEDIPEAWLPRLAELGYNLDGIRQAPLLDAISEQYRDAEAETAPLAPEGALQAPRPVVIDYATVAGYVEGAYKLTAQMAVRPADPLLADVIDEHAAQAGIAWAHWIESEPKVAALLQRLMIGTPLGEVIGVHVAIIFSYTVARSAYRAAAERAASAGEAVAADGAFEGAPEDIVV